MLFWRKKGAHMVIDELIIVTADKFFSVKSM